MKQLTIYCSEELTHEVSQVLHRNEVEGYMHLPGIYGNKLKAKGSFEKDLAWPANVFIVFPSEEQLTGIVNELQEYVNRCDVEPCLRMVVAPVEQLY